MSNQHPPPVPPVHEHIWTVSEAKARLSEILRRASEEGPQRIGTRRGYIVIDQAQWQRLYDGLRRPPLGQWLLTHIEPGEPLPVPDRADPPRALPFDTDAEAR